MIQSFLEKYRIHYIGCGNMPTTADQAVEKIGRFLRKFRDDYGVSFEEEMIVGLTPRVLHAWYDNMTNAGLKMSTRNNYVALLNPFLEWLDENDYIQTIPGKKPIYQVLTINKLPKEEEIPEEERKQRCFTEEQVRMLFSSVSGCNAARDRAILALFLSSALRVSELCSLTLGSVVNQQQGRIYVKRKGGAWKYTEVADFCYKHLNEYLKSRDLSDLSQPLFLTTHKTPCSRKQIWDVISRKELALNLTSGVHILRHTTISNVEKKGGAGVARDVANHKTLAMTNQYDHTTAEERAAALNRLDWVDL